MGDSASALFSARWQTRVEMTRELSGIIFSSHASGGSRVTFDGVVVLDAWDKHGSTFSVSGFSLPPVSLEIPESGQSIARRATRWRLAQGTTISHSSTALRIRTIPRPHRQTHTRNYRGVDST